MEAFTPISATLGGIMIGVATAAMFYLNGRVVGISGIVGGLVRGGKAGARGWQLQFLAGMVMGGVALLVFDPQVFGVVSSVSTPSLAAAGLLVGVGTHLANGCTSGHGVCGISRLSPRSLVATATFMGTGALTVYVLRHLLTGGL